MREGLCYLGDKIYLITYSLVYLLPITASHPVLVLHFLTRFGKSKITQKRSHSFFKHYLNAKYMYNSFLSIGNHHLNIL